MNTLDQFLAQLVLGVTSNAVYDFLRDIFTRDPSNPSRGDLQTRLASFLRVENAEIVASKIIDFLAQNGDIQIKGTKIYAGDSIRMFSSRNSRMTLGEQSASFTSNTGITTGPGAAIVAEGGAGWVQGEDGSARFSA